ncbi:MAG: twin transmembrane helix small protein [Rhizobiaceae bacterium]|nr:twin transmembrane helix small protein [Hyphomicrobiales bacterium]NRB29362.1 twin transmembrane helix small protein [Rhizobiaceae bacterium]
MQIVIVIACFIVGIILIRGLWNMMQNGPGNKSQQLMRLRVIAQAITVVLVVVVVYMTR